MQPHAVQLGVRGCRLQTPPLPREAPVQVPGAPGTRSSTRTRSSAQRSPAEQLAQLAWAVPRTTEPKTVLWLASSQTTAIAEV